MGSDLALGKLGQGTTTAKVWPLLILAAILLCGVGLIFCLVPVLAQGATIRLRASQTEIRVGQVADVTAAIENVAGLYGAELRLSFNPDVLQVVDADEVISGTQITPGQFPYSDFVAKNEADNAAGTVWYAVTQLAPREPASGSGTMATVRFQAKAAGTGNIRISFAQLAGPDGLEIPTAIGAGSEIRVLAPLVEIPEPAPLTLVASGIGALAAYMGLRRARIIKAY